LDSKLNDKFYSKKIRLNPSNDASIAEFMTTLKKWRSSATLEAIAIEFIPLDARYKYDRLNDMTKLLNVVNKREMVSYLQDDTKSIIVVVSTTHTTKEIPIVWKGSD